MPSRVHHFLQMSSNFTTLKYKPIQTTHPQPPYRRSPQTSTASTALQPPHPPQGQASDHQAVCPGHSNDFSQPKAAHCLSRCLRGNHSKGCYPPCPFPPLLRIHPGLPLWPRQDLCLLLLENGEHDHSLLQDSHHFCSVRLSGPGP